ncbi:MAG: SRPBCC family protein [Actinomycetota bacterium]|nr:SRPBCC family protein [Actinomycetota bacterium]
MIAVQRTFLVQKSPDVVNYLKDFSRAQDWDPGTKTCTREDAGPIAEGSTWHNVSVLRGRDTELTYRLARLEPDHLTFVGKNKTATSTDDMAISAAGTGTSITYHVDIEFHGLAKLAGPFLQSEFEHLGDQTEDQLTRIINAL